MAGAGPGVSAPRPVVSPLDPKSWDSVRAQFGLLYGGLRLATGDEVLITEHVESALRAVRALG